MGQIRGPQQSILLSGDVLADSPAFGSGLHWRRDRGDCPPIGAQGSILSYDGAVMQVRADLEAATERIRALQASIEGVIKGKREVVELALKAQRRWDDVLRKFA